MPSQPTSTQNRLDNIAARFTVAVNTVSVLAESFDTPFLEPISKTAQSLLVALQNVKQNKTDCAQLIEQTYGLLYAIISAYTKSEGAAPEFPPSMLSDLGKFTETLCKIHAYVEAQQDKSKLRQFFRQGEMSTLLKACNAGLQDALEIFKVENINILGDVADIQKYADNKHQEVLELIEALPEGTISDGASLGMSAFHNSSMSISMLPSEPRIFHGREAELSAILEVFAQTTPRLAILGPGGIGKTSLARAVLHHPHVADKFEKHRFFVACDSASTKIELVALIGAHLGLKPGKDLTGPIIRFFTGNPASLLILDNLETVWEPMKTRGDIEEFLSLLTDVQHVSLLITMRGAERPTKVAWTRPFFPQLKTLTQEAARQTFMDITDDGHDLAEIDQIPKVAPTF
ncbi:hypothetical protein C8R43DRAFT_1136704 [Mycena crocata]|nr:hypothetical protein C8R43DRAFT_1136704 [Mycena crocata]